MFVLILFGVNAILSLIRGSGSVTSGTQKTSENHMNQTHLSVETLQITSRKILPCSRNDVNCWSEKAKDYTNDVRRRHGVKKMLRLGTKSQLMNALLYAEKLAGRGELKHQSLSKATKEVGCQRWIGGENLAMNSGQGDVAKACVEQWVNSKGHFANLVRDWFEEVVVGIHFDRHGRAFCVQTFASQSSLGTRGKPTDRGCETVGRHADEEEETAPETKEEEKEELDKSEPRSAADTAGNRSCRCLRAGKRCWGNLASQTGGNCRSRTARGRQPGSCKQQCCEYCKKVGDRKICGYSGVREMCQNR